MKVSNHSIVIIIFFKLLKNKKKLKFSKKQDGTLIGTAFFVCFSYWIGISFAYSSMSFIFNTTITLFNYLSLIVRIIISILI